MTWKPRIAEDINSEAAFIREADWDEAQSLANFIVMKPETLPEGGRIVSSTMRPEAPPGRTSGTGATGRPDWTTSNRSCHRFEVVTGRGRIRTKQFLYDWAPPAFDHPSLWRDFPRAFPLREEICWVGKNYLKRHAASLHRARTMIEVSVLSGSFADEQLAEFCESFHPANTEAEKKIGCTSLADLCYQSRHPEIPICVPTGYWLHQRKGLKSSAMVVRADRIPSAAIPQLISPPGYQLDCAFLYLDSEYSSEADFLFTSQTDKNRYVRLLAFKSANSLGENRYPLLDEQPCLTSVLTVAGRPAFHAYLTEKGPHEAFWQQNSNSFICLTKPHPASGFTPFVAFLEYLVKAVAKGDFCTEGIFKTVT